MNEENPLVTAALQYAGRGWHVFPCTWIIDGECSCQGRVASCSPGKHPLTPNGFYGATTDPLLIQTYWETWPLANVAIRTGAESNLVIVDIDDRRAWNELKKILPPNYDWKSVPRQKTGKPDGWHLGFSYPGTHVKTGTKFLPGVDSRGDGGYIMAAPSIHLSGKKYRWQHLPPGDQFPRLPAELLLAINGTNSNGREPLNTAEFLKGVPQGQQRVTAARLAGKFRHADIPIEYGQELILKFAHNCTPPLSEKEALSQLHDIYKRYPATADEPPEQQTQETFWPVPMTAKEFLNRPKDQRRWILEDSISYSSTTLLAAAPRVGKSTFAFNLSLAVARGLPFLGRATTAVPVFYLSMDNSADDMDELAKSLGLSENDQLMLHTGAIPTDSIGWLRDIITRFNYKLVIIDTLQRFYQLDDANDYAEATRRMTPVDNLVKELGVHIVYLHHAGKNGEYLGSVGLKGMCPTYLQIKRIGEEEHLHRVLSSDQRSGKNFESVAISFDKHGWLKVVGTLEDVFIEDTKPKVLELLEIEQSGMTEAQIRDVVGGRGIVLSKAIRQLLAEGKVERTGAGKKTGAYRYHRAALLFKNPTHNPSEDCHPKGRVVGVEKGGLLRGEKNSLPNTYIGPKLAEWQKVRD